MGTPLKVAIIAPRDEPFAESQLNYRLRLKRPRDKAAGLRLVVKNLAQSDASGEAHSLDAPDVRNKRQAFKKPRF
jgi:hypothetical protein